VRIYAQCPGCSYGENGTPTSHASWACDDGDVYWLDGCGAREEVKEPCLGAGCTDGACLPGVWYGLGGSASGAGINGGAYATGGGLGIALDAAGNPAVTWITVPYQEGEVYLRRWNGESWEELGGSATLGGISNSIGQATATLAAVDGGGNPIVAWGVWGDSAAKTYLREWTGASWIGLGGSESGDGIEPGLDTFTFANVLAVDATDNPVIAWFGSWDSDHPIEFAMRRWGGSVWEDPGISELSAWSTEGQALALDANSLPTAVWSENDEIYLRRWNGATWEELGGSASGGGVSNTYYGSIGPNIAVDADGDPSVVWIERFADHNAVYLKRWDGTAWQELGGSASGDGVNGSVSEWYSCAIVMDTAGDPIVSWRVPGERDSYGNVVTHNIYLRRWDGGAWVEIGGSGSGHGLGVINREFAMALPRAGRLCLTWENAQAVFVRCTDLP
jgi:hypothetical protein